MLHSVREGNCGKHDCRIVLELTGVSVPKFIVDAYRRVGRIEKSFRMFKHDLQGRPIYSRQT